MPHRTFSEWSNDHRLLIDQAMAAYVDYGSDCPDALRGAIRHSFLAPGKRLRPLLVLMAGEACGLPTERAIPAACAVEMVHTYSLIHDDLPAMDDDDLRRGLPSCHIKFGEANAILAGDALLAQAFEVLATDAPSPEAAARSCAVLAKAAGALALVGGQADDLAFENQKGNIEQLEAIHRRKTGALFIASLELGAVWADASTEQVKALRAYGANLGLAFQVIDDLLDFGGDEAVLGKRAGKDIDRGKLTFPGCLGVDESRRRAEQLIQEAQDAITIFGPKSKYLGDLADYILERNR
ncbi:MAG: polyprenyl synthetase family protein [bacterium]|nr:polyprenyl synthetase family protein [bacterium]